MKMKLSDYVVDFIASQGVRHAFVVSGGASIHLLHSLNSRPGIEPICPHHEQSGAMAADAYSRVSGNLGCAIGTSGPGATNLITGIAGAWFDSIPVLYIAGQVTTFRLKGDSGVRQYGFQETEIIPMVRPITKYCVQIRDHGQIRYELEKAVHIARSGRPGPVLIDLPDDLQRAEIETETLVGYQPEKEGNLSPGDDQIDDVLMMLGKAERPIMILGNGVRLAGAAEDARNLAERWSIPVLTTWGAKDILPSDHPQNVGTFGTHGTRAGNFAMQNSDFVLSIGARLSTRETGSPLTDWARAATIAIVDIDPAELGKFQAFDRPVELTIVADAAETIATLLARNTTATGDLTGWREKISQWQHRYPVVPHDAHDAKDVHPYALIDMLSTAAPKDLQIFIDTGCSIAWLMQAFRVSEKQRTYHDFNNTAMGWGLPAAIGGALALGSQTLCVTGDGSLMMNVQEFATIAHHKLPVKTIIIDNRGYSMVRQTEEQWLDGVNVGTSDDSGLGFPDWVALTQSFGLETHSVRHNADLAEALNELFATDGPAVLHVDINHAHRVTPQVAFGHGIEDAEPFLPREEFLSQMIIEPLPRSRETTEPSRTLPSYSKR